MAAPEPDESAPADAPADAPAPPRDTAPAAAGPWMTGAQLAVFTAANQDR